VNRGELKKAIVFAFGFCTSLFAAIGIGAAAWGFGLLDGWLGKMGDGVSVMSTLAWLPVTFLLWIVPPVIAVALLAGRAEKALADKPGFKHETANG
jgi:hypothetical protein